MNSNLRNTAIDETTGLLPNKDKIIVPNGGGYMAADFENPINGLAEYWEEALNTGLDATYSIETGNGYTGNAQRVDYDAPLATQSSAIRTTDDIVIAGRKYRLQFLYRGSKTFKIYIESISIGNEFSTLTNIGNAILHDITFTASNSGKLAFLMVLGAGISGWFSFSEVNLEELPCIAHYPLKGNVNDVSGNGYNGTAINSPDLNVTDRFGYNTKAIELDGINQYINYVANMISNSILTVSAWVKPVSLGTIMNIFGRYDLIADSNNINYVAINTDGTVRLFSGSQTNQIYFTSNSIISTGEWYHIVAYMDILNEEFKVYVNGQKVEGNVTKLGTPATAFNTSTVTFKTGLIRTGAGFIYTDNTVFRDIYAFNRELTQDEIMNLYLEKPDIS